VSALVSRDQPVPGGQQEISGQGGVPPGLGSERRNRRGGWPALGVAVVAAAGAVAAWQAGAFPHQSVSPGSGHGTPPPATATVTKQDITATTPVNATLGYAGSYAVTGQGSGTLTWLPSAGQVIVQGQVLYRTDNGSPAVLLYGSVPAWRSMYEGLTGQDVAQLNHDLVALGYANRADIVAMGWDHYSRETASAVVKLEEHLGVSWPPGSLSLGQFVFKPEALRVSELTGSLGGTAAGPVLTATSDRHVVNIPLDASQQTDVKVGDKVTVTLPNGTTTPGLITSVGSVATISSGQGSAPTAIIPVEGTLTDPNAAGSLDQAPVTVNITTATARDALTVPVSALLAQSAGEYEVEVVGPEGTRQYVRVTVGIFDDADGQVQVTGALTPGQRVVVAAS